MSIIEKFFSFFYSLLLDYCHTGEKKFTKLVLNFI